jgi:hypothetical protein
VSRESALEAAASRAASTKRAQVRRAGDLRDADRALEVLVDEAQRASDLIPRLRSSVWAWPIQPALLRHLGAA